jgi:hypothetical protein
MGPNAKPEGVARAFIEAKNAGDLKRFLGFMTTAARQALESGQGGAIAEGKIERYTIGETEITGDLAEVGVTSEQDGARQNLKLVMRHEDGAWRVYGVKVVLGEDNEMTINFEKVDSMVESMAEGIGESMAADMQKAFEDAARGGSEEEIARKKVVFESIVATSEDEFASSWRNPTDLRGKSAREAVEELALGCDLVTHVGDHGEILEKPVEVDVRGVSRVEAIERICEQIGLYPIYPSATTMSYPEGAVMGKALGEMMSRMLTSEDSAISLEGGESEGVEKVEASAPDTPPPPNAVTFATGTPPWPRVHVGPFVISVDGVDEYVPHGTGAVDVGIRTFGLKPGTLSLIADLGETIRLHRIVDTQERTLMENADVRYFGGGMITGTAFESTTRVALRNLLRDVETIDRIEGAQKLALPLQVQTLEFESLDEGASQTVGDLHIGVKSKNTGSSGNTNTTFEIKGPEEALAQLKVRFWATNASGNDLGIIFESCDYWHGGRANANLQTAEAPARVRMKLIIQRKELEFPFSLRGAALARHAEMPEKIEDLSFDGDAPIEVSFVRFKDKGGQFPMALLRTSNRSNKDALQIHAQFNYVDRQGKTLKDFPHTISGTFDMNGRQPVVRSGASPEVESTAFFMPEQTAGIVVTLNRVEFVDGTSWEKS